MSERDHILGSLSDRERQIGEMIAIGFTHSEIGQVLKLTPNYVSKLAMSLAEKLPGETPPSRRIARFFHKVSATSTPQE